jgi:putative tryptophan/tyrosine transport system substrate-binding protein
MNDPQPGGSHGKPHRTTKILSHARRRGRLAAHGARAAGCDAGVGFLGATSPEPYASLLSAFRKGLNEEGLVDGRNVAIECRWAEGQYDRMPVLADDLVRRKVSVIAAVGGTPSVLAAKAATSTIPVVFAIGVDPVKFGLVASLNRPGGSLTGVVLFTGLLGTKRLGLLRELVPKADTIAMLVHPNNPLTEGETKDVQTATRTTGHELRIVTATNEDELNAAFGMLVQMQPGALLVGADPLFYGRREQLVALAARHSIPTMYELREFVVAGGLISYGASLTDGYRQAGVYVARILKGERPHELPVTQPTKFELVINLKTAKALRLDVPPMLLARADEVIE